MTGISIYIHIPFCLHKCPYCDFNTYALATFPEREYTAAILSELDYRATLAEWRGREVQTIYFGGGTPSIFEARSIARILQSISRLFPVSNRAEISLEANPGTIDTELLGELREAGINRLSIGAQSFSRELLKVLGRMHSPEQIEAAVLSARTVGFSNVSLDLIYGVPGQSPEQWEAELGAAALLKVDHISAYGLTIEKGTPFYQSYRRGLLRLPPEDAVVSMMELANSTLPELGYKHYEISNFAREGFEARHNLAYWNGADYLGIGAGAHSFVRCEPPFGDNHGMRWSNFALPNKYIKEVSSHGQAEGWRDTLSKSDAIFEFFFLGLRRIEGVKDSEFKAKFNLEIKQSYPFIIDMLMEQGLVEFESGNLRLSDKGILLADSVIEHFVTEPSAELPQAVNTD
ncbi:MAG: radical SAM family heme chaperone HemW [Oligoflexia bacterium]|nr:radical SAM family heme chaperone HemW [Oligoflexia bacterium]